MFYSNRLNTSLDKCLVLTREKVLCIVTNGDRRSMITVLYDNNQELVDNFSPSSVMYF